MYKNTLTLGTRHAEVARVRSYACMLREYYLVTKLSTMCQSNYHSLSICQYEKNESN